MRIARVRPRESAREALALERDGAVYDVAELEERFDTRYSPTRFAQSSDFATRVLGLGGDGLGELDRKLCAGARPTEARIQDEDLLWLAPIDTERALVVIEEERAEGARLVGLSARRALGHDAMIAVATPQATPEVTLTIAAILGEDLAHARADVAERAILGFTLLGLWTNAERDPWLQLGPVLVTRNELRDVDELRFQIRVERGGESAPVASTTAPFPALGQRLARASEAYDLRAGDAIAASALLTASAPLITFGDRVELCASRLGRLAGRPARGG